jgi:hypothetical protein
VKWVGASDDDATWKNEWRFFKSYPHFRPWGQGQFECAGLLRASLNACMQRMHGRGALNVGADKGTN